MYPWHNLPDSSTEIEEEGIDSVIMLHRKKKPLLKKGGDSLWIQFKQNSSYLKSPVFIGMDSKQVELENCRFS